MLIHKAVFVCSSSKVSQCPKASLPEYAFIGRSNVGKSSLINMLTGVKGLAKVSSTPGKTKLVNHFVVDDSWYLVDLPGYGYARTSKKERSAFSAVVTEYIAKRESLSLLFVLIDSRLEPQAIDLDFISKLGEYGIPFSIIFTKADKLSKRDTHANVRRFKQRLLEDWEELPPLFITSSETQMGKDEVLSYIGGINKQLKQAAL